MILKTPVLIAGRFGNLAEWLGQDGTLDLLSPEQAAWLSLFGLLLISAASGTMLFVFSRFYYRDVPVEHMVDNSLIPASMLSTLVFYQSAPWPGLSILMVAILAFVHYRTVIKDFSDITFVFWAILSGLFIGLGFFWQIPAANLVLAAAGILAVHLRSRRQRYLVLIRCLPEAVPELQVVFKQLKARTRSQTERNGTFDLTVEVPLRNISIAVIDDIAAMNGVHSAVMLNKKSAGNGGLSNEDRD